MAENAVDVAVKAWGEKSLSELEAEDRLSYASEKVWSTTFHPHVEDRRCKCCVAF